MMPIAMLIGALGYNWFHYLSFCTPYLIAVMLFISYCNISWREIHITPMHICLLTIQIVGSIGAYLLINPFNPYLAQGAMICFLAPTATSAVVITGMLGGNMASLTSYSIFCNIVVAVLAPIMFSTIDAGALHPTFFESLVAISQKVFLLLLLPLALALLLDRFLPRLHEKIKRSQSISFYLWSVALIVVTSRIVYFIIGLDSSSGLLLVGLALIALMVCGFQFVAGRYIGRRFGDTVAGGQGLGQKNTILAIWMAQTYMNPISSVAPGAYVLWQNIINSYQVWRQMNKKGRLAESKVKS